MTEGRPNFIGDRHGVTQYDEKAELYAQECAALKELIRKHGWPKGWPKEGQWVMLRNGTPMLIMHPTLAAGFDPLPCGETVMMLMDWMLSGEWEAVMTIHDDGRVDIDLGKGIWVREPSLTLALCAAVRAKMQMEAGK